MNRSEKDWSYSIQYSLAFNFFFALFINWAFYLGNVLYKKGRHLEFIAALALSIGFISTVEDYVLVQLFQDHTGRLQHAINLLFMLFIAGGIKSFRDHWVRQYQRKEAHSQQLESELSYLRSQINAHFLFNTLNNMYGASLKDPMRSPEMILALSDLLRYQLESTHRGYVPLNQELAFLDNYLALEKLHCTSLNRVDVKISGAVGGQLIAPMLLLPFIENAFKHGLHPVQESFIDITLTVNQESLCLRVINSLLQRKNGYASTGIGIANVEKRLALVYPHRYRLEVHQDDRTYQTQLTIFL